MSTPPPSAQGIPKTMQAVRLHAPGGPESLVFEKTRTPRPVRGEALVRVHAAAITRDELEWPTDRLPAIPSYEFSGEVVAVGPDASGVSVGDGVFALSGFDRDGGAADFVTVPALLLAPKPRTIDHVRSAAIPLAALSAWQGLFDHGRLEPGQRVIIHGAAGGVGHFATQLARWRGAYVVGSAAVANHKVIREFGADEVIDYSSDFVESLDAVDLVFDTIGGEALKRSPAALREGGRLVSVAERPPEVSPEAKVDAIYFVVEPNRDQLLEVSRLVDSGEVRPAIDSVFPLANARAAFERSLAAGKHGKVVLSVVDE